MKRTAAQRVFALALFLLAAIAVLAVPTSSAKADMFPKPTLKITFENMGDSPCYCTLLSQTFTTGPWSAYNYDDDYIPEEYENDPEGYAIWRAFVDYEDGDGFYYLQYHRRCDESKIFEWNYYAPSTFKILLYYPETNTFVSGGVCKEYAFNSYFTATLSNGEIGAVETPELSARRSYDYGGEIGKLIARVAITVGLELCIALIFGFRKRKYVLAVLTVNVVTQLILNIALNIIKFYSGIVFLPLVLILSEGVVFGLEAAAYSVIFSRPKFVGTDALRVSTAKILLYTLAANIVSLAFGLLVTIFAPDIAY